MRHVPLFLFGFMLVVVAAMPLKPLYAASQEGSVPYISGGIGDDEFDEIASQKDKYNTKLLFTEANGEYLSDVAVAITDSKGNAVLSIVTEGPVLLVKLKPGTYKVKATEAGRVKESRLSVGAKGRAYQQFAFPALEGAIE